ncbi:MULTISPECIES: hypothetical protein [Nocardia]|uniref:ATP synthase subunit I n=1 Tax=Nocardia wallacei TaxID=480035 RepID=A0A7G1KQB8_9NOCA|nr:hypothetical protein [Nocardia wallacei]BCK57427.1 hypothetical protein NWFMUON74_51990 [Nocardia wallacei]
MNVNRLRIRRAAIVAIAVGVLALMAAGALDHLLLGVFTCVGLGLGWANARLTWSSVTRITRSETPSKQALTVSTAGRLFGITVLSLLVAFLARPDGIGIFFGLAVFQVVLILLTVVPEVKGLRQLP